MSNCICTFCSGMKQIRKANRFFAKVGCQSLAYELKVLCASVMDMVILARSSLKVCYYLFNYRANSSMSILRINYCFFYKYYLLAVYILLYSIIIFRYCEAYSGCWLCCLCY